MKFIACDPYLSSEQKEKHGLPFVSLEQLLRESDYVTIHSPVTPETRHLINAKTLSFMKPTAYLVNTARGPIVDADALAAALRAKKIAGAAIDVFDVEPPPTAHPLFSAPNVILTPHIGWASEEAGWEIRKSILADILAFAQRKTARCVVNKELLKGGKP